LATHYGVAHLDYGESFLTGPWRASGLGRECGSVDDAGKPRKNLHHQLMPSTLDDPFFKKAAALGSAAFKGQLFHPPRPRRSFWPIFSEISQLRGPVVWIGAPILYPVICPTAECGKLFVDANIFQESCGRAALIRNCTVIGEGRER